MMKPTPTGPMFGTGQFLAECATVGITLDTPVIIYCFKGARASNTFVALEEAGIRERRHLLWLMERMVGAIPSLPIEEGLPYAQPRLAA